MYLYIFDESAVYLHLTHDRRFGHFFNMQFEKKKLLFVYSALSFSPSNFGISPSLFFLSLAALPWVSSISPLETLSTIYSQVFCYPSPSLVLSSIQWNRTRWCTRSSPCRWVAGRCLRDIQPAVKLKKKKKIKGVNSCGRIKELLIPTITYTW